MTVGDRAITRRARQILLAAMPGAVGVLLWCAADGVKAAERPRLATSVEDDGATITIDGELFTRYLKRSGARPALWPIIGPTGKPMTRAYSVTAPAPGEEIDHPHHRSAWFGYEGVNGCDFWQSVEPGVDRPYPAGTITHREWVRADSDGQTATIDTLNDWRDPSGNVVCHDERLLQFGVDGDARYIDFRIRLWSSKGPLRLIDTKEGMFAVRVASTMRVDARQGGQIVASTGREDVDAWGQPAAWVDYHGPVAGETVGIAIMAHPNSYNPQPRWHVRPYGLFAANPIGVDAYLVNSTNAAPPTPAKIALELPENEPLKLRYRILLHRGDEEQGNVAGAFAKFAKAK